jgi:hypothetical protein
LAPTALHAMQRCSSAVCVTGSVCLLHHLLLKREAEQHCHITGSWLWLQEGGRGRKCFNGRGAIFCMCYCSGAVCVYQVGRGKGSGGALMTAVHVMHVLLCPLLRCFKCWYMTF